MKKIFTSCITLLTLFSMVIFSCKDAPANFKGTLEFDSITVNKTVHLFNDTAKPACNILLNFAHVSQAADTLLKDSLNSFMVAAFFGERYIGENPNDIVSEYASEYVQKYLKDVEPMYLESQKSKETANDVEGWYSYYKALESEVQFYENDLLVYRIDYNEYTGGAHGMYMSSYLNFDLQQMFPIRLDDIFVGDYKEALTDLIWNQLMADNNVTTHEELEDLGYASTGDIAPTENFYLDRNGITFHYNVYDITPYSMGAVKVTLPFEIMEHLLGSNPVIDQLRK